MEKVIIRKDYSKINTFEREDYIYTKYAESDNYILWRVYRDIESWRPAWDKYELWKKVYVKNPDGTRVVRKLRDEDGGKNLWFFNNFDDFKHYLDRFPNKFPEEVSQFCHQ